MGPNVEDAPDILLETMDDIDSSQVGLAPRIIVGLFRSIDLCEETKEFTIKASYFEIYMERVNDLLSRMFSNNNIQSKKKVISLMVLLLFFPSKS